MKLIAQGAEAKIWQEKGKVIKERVQKRYRLPEIDEKLRLGRTRAEARLISLAARAGVNVPQILGVDKKKNLEIEFIDGPKLRDVLEPALCKEIGKQIAKMHSADVVHGDLTTSNMMLRAGQIYLIDFGLAQHSTKEEDKAVDIHLFKECLKSKHFDIWENCWKEFLKSYNNKAVLKRLETVEKRGKYRKA